MLQHSGFTKWTYGKDPKQSPTRDDVLDNFSLYWLTNTVASSARIYWENRGQNLTSSADRGGHFAMWEYPELFASELRAAFKPLR